ncbi:MAG: cell division transport system permease protein [bacterium P3]|nr:MAG: cell division transport system permease protein [bacterium P3]KWW42024.1 MAG: cell division transport system permease protein [bacterium F083]
MKRKRNSHGAQSSTLLSITLVLFLLGLLLLLEYHSYRITRETQERITYKVDLVPDIDSASVSQLRKEISQFPYVKHVDYISKEDAAEIFSGDIGEDFIGFIGYNPLYPSMMVNFRADLLPQKSSQVLDGFCQAMALHDYVTGVNYQEVVVSELYTIFHKLTWFLIVFITLLLIVCVMMIHSAVQLSFHSMGETIQTMRLVGATRGFIARPFILKGILYGALGGVIADLMLAIAVITLDKQMQLNLLNPDYAPHYAAIACGIVAAGILITWLSTVPAIHRQLKTEIR